MIRVSFLVSAVRVMPAALDASEGIGEINQTCARSE
jgi:hypothetical protein